MCPRELDPGSIYKSVRGEGSRYNMILSWGRWGGGGVRLQTVGVYG